MFDEELFDAGLRDFAGVNFFEAVFFFLGLLGGRDAGSLAHVWAQARRLRFILR
jgi:hypothetical protein